MFRSMTLIALLSTSSFCFGPVATSAPAQPAEAPAFTLDNVTGTAFYKKAQNSRIDKFVIQGRSSKSVTITPLPAGTAGSWGGGSPNFKVTLDAGALLTLFNAGCTGFRITNADGDVDATSVTFPAMRN